MQSSKQHWALCLHCAKDHHDDLFTTFKVSIYRPTTLLTNSQHIKLIIVIIQLKVKKLLTKPASRHIPKPHILVPVLSRREQINISSYQGAFHHFNGLVGCSFEPRGQLLKLKVSGEGNRKHDCQSKQARSGGRLKLCIKYNLLALTSQ